MNQKIKEFFPFPEFRLYQEEILEKIINDFEAGKEVVIIEAPVGFGKSPVNITLGKYFRSAFYTTPQIKLVQQLVKDFCPKKLAISGGISREIMALLGRRNYKCKASNEYSDICPLRGEEDGCSENDGCTYRIQKEHTKNAKIAITTFAMLIFNTYLPEQARFKKRDLLIVDECHSLESQAAGMFAGFTLSKRKIPKLIDGLKLEEIWSNILLKLPKSDNIMDYISFFEGFENLMEKYNLEHLYLEPKRAKDKMENLFRQIRYMLNELSEKRVWVITISGTNNDNKSFKFAPVLVDRFLQQKIWSQAEKIILTSATIPFRNDVKKWLNLIGLGNKKFSIHSVPMSFPVENRKIITSYMGGKMTYKEEQINWQRNINLVKTIIRNHPNERGVIHTQSYSRAKHLFEDLRGFNCYLHNNEEINENIINDWINSGKKILISPAIKEGVDLKDDLCRFQILLKVPYPNVQDARVKYLLNVKKEWTWYNEETTKDIVQSYGRAIRSPEDYATFYIIDESFNKLPKKGFPKYFLEALENYKEEDDKYLHFEDDD